MTAGQIAGLIAAGAFLLLVLLCAVPLLKLGRVLDEMRVAVKGVGDSSVPILEELRGTVQATNVELEKIAVVTDDAAKVSGHATVVSENAAQVVSLVSAAIATPLRPIAGLGRRLRTRPALTQESPQDQSSPQDQTALRERD